MNLIIEWRTLLALLCCSTSIALLSCVSVERQTYASLDELIAKPASYDGKRVQILGYVEASRERYRVWKSRAHAENSEPSVSCINIGFPDSMDVIAYDGKHVELEGVFIERVNPSLIILGSCLNRHMIQVDEALPPRVVPEVR